MSGPFTIVTAVLLLINEVGWIGLAAPILFLIGFLIQLRLFKKGSLIKKDQLLWSDRRSKCIKEYFAGIRVIKYYGWEELVTVDIKKIRKEELAVNEKLLVLKSYIEVAMNLIPHFTFIVIFTGFIALEGEEALTPAKVFIVLSIFNLINTPMKNLTLAFTNLMSVRASMARLDHFFDFGEKS